MKRVLVYSRLGCPHCKAAKALLDANGIPYHGERAESVPAAAAHPPVPL